MAAHSSSSTSDWFGQKLSFGFRFRVADVETRSDIRDLRCGLPSPSRRCWVVRRGTDAQDAGKHGLPARLGRCLSIPDPVARPGDKCSHPPMRGIAIIPGVPGHLTLEGRKLDGHIA